MQACVVLERTFRDFPSAAHSVFSSITKQMLGVALPLPKFFVYGLLSSVFKVCLCYLRTELKYPKQIT